MSWVDTLNGEVEEVLSTEWNVRDGTVVPESETVALKDGAVKINATFLYADLAGSSRLARLCPWQTTAKIIRAYLNICTRLIKAYEGEIRSFDGDRVMGVFIGDLKNTHATKCAREIDWAVENIINPKAKAKYKSIQDNNIHIKHCIGIDTGEAVAVRAGIRDNNDLIWIGRAPSLAAKFSDIRNYPYAVYITAAVFKQISTQDQASSWESTSITVGDTTEPAYKTKHTLEP